MTAPPGGLQILSVLTLSHKVSVMTDFWRRVPRHHLIRVGYGVAGLKIGTLWMAQGDSSPAEHAVHLMALLVAIMAVTDVARRLAARRGRRVAHHPIGRFLLAKTAVVGLAVVAGIVVDGWLPHAELWVGAGLVVLIGAVGPLLHPWLINAARPAPTRMVDEPVLVAA